jgi:hypothetical protein
LKSWLSIIRYPVETSNQTLTRDQAFNLAFTEPVLPVTLVILHVDDPNDLFHYLLLKHPETSIFRQGQGVKEECGGVLEQYAA